MINTVLNKERVRCRALDRNYNQCRLYKLDETTDYCKNHQYMNTYTEEMLSNLKLCSGCNKMFYFGSTINVRCQNCYYRGTLYNKQKSEENKQTNRCLAKNGCKYKRSVENIYCGKHQLYAFEDLCISENMRPCYHYKRGCRNKLPTEYKLSSCKDCLQKIRIIDKIKRNNVITNNVENNHNQKHCSVCYKLKHTDEFNSERLKDGEFTKMCFTCREQCKIQDSRRDKEHVNELARINCLKPERIKVKNIWKENNYDKIVESWKKSREKQIQQNREEYLKKQSEFMKKWRDNNPEKVKEINIKNKNNSNYMYKRYQQKCVKLNKEFNISNEEFDEIIRAKCFYCGFTDSRGFNGIDRIDSTKGYELINVVNCCKMCNYMKAAVDIKTFIKRVIHILSYNKIELISSLYPEAFANYERKSGIKYKSYMNNVIKRKNIVFTLTETDFYNLIEKSCYICGKENSVNHNNGIDRFDSSIGYTVENSKTCCANCNYMKNKYEYNVFIEKLKAIYIYLSNKGILQEILNLEEGTYGPTIINSFTSNKVKPK